MIAETPVQKISIDILEKSLGSDFPSITSQLYDLYPEESIGMQIKRSTFIIVQCVLTL